MERDREDHIKTRGPEKTPRPLKKEIDQDWSNLPAASELELMDQFTDGGLIGYRAACPLDGPAQPSAFQAPSGTGGGHLILPNRGAATFTDRGNDDLNLRLAGFTNNPIAVVRQNLPTPAAKGRKQQIYKGTDGFRHAIGSAEDRFMNRPYTATPK
jgi:hypothetical protein